MGRLGFPPPNELMMFAQVIGATYPIYFDDAAAKAAGLETICVHGGYLNLFHFEKVLVTAANTNPVFPTMHNRSTIDFFAPIYSGDILTVKSRVSNKVQSSKGKKFAAFEIEIYNQKGEKVARKIHSGSVNGQERNPAQGLCIKCGKGGKK